MRKTNRRKLQWWILLLSLIITWLVKWETKNLVSDYEDKYETSTLKSRCYLAQLNRISKNEKIKLWYCEIPANLEKFRLEETNWILWKLKLQDCKIIQSELEQIQETRWGVYATNIAYTRWKSFNAYAISFWTISLVWKDEKLWNYLILKEWVNEYVYGHTKTNLKVWDKINKGDMIGQITDKNYYLHFEQWKDGVNISSEWFVNDDSLKLKIERGWLTKEDTDKQDTPTHHNPYVNKDILNFISKYEGVHLTAYWDINHYSIWYGTPSYKWEVISKKEADRRRMERIQRIKNVYGLNSLSTNKQIAIVSFIYNIWSLTKKQQWLLENNHIKALANNIKQYQFSKWQKLKWLTRRRYAEYALIN
jgi:GH24 family phage-related lysozyme (muramidase)